jgi:hypothetical protein
MAELLALRDGLELALSLGIPSPIVELYALEVVHLFYRVDSVHCLHFVIFFIIKG